MVCGRLFVAGQQFNKQDNKKRHFAKEMVPNKACCCALQQHTAVFTE
jgi:hypothetical protein